ncbi:thioredoxin domain-containing protein 3-like [Pipistrellus kuhlii]|uniref:thioredoxin domain-containing protein 3-like n=1 Tax=Pipistrellus kuhlii TaxID=59472 RepID=UPI001E270EBA|nr:thioredoxin domain-containing protein 3-like [Pipistrellus kuhlii]
MAGKKREIQLQAVINTQSLWEEMLQNKGVTVIDVYQAWCGPCKAMQTLFRKLRNELNEEEILHFVVAEADSILALQPFRDNCEPVFLFSVNGKIISKIEGANAPLVNHTIINLVNEERKIVAGEMDRPQYHEITLGDPNADARKGSKESIDRIYSIAIIKPEAMNTGKTIEIKENIANAGFVIEAEDNRLLTENQVRNFYRQKSEQPDFEEFVSLMTNRLSCVLVVSRSNEQEFALEGENITEPETEPQEPPEDQPEMDTPPVVKKKWDSTLEEYLDKENIHQFCDVEEDEENVHKFIDMFFPDFKNIKVEKILILLRPDLFQAKKEDVLSIILNEGFLILMQRQVVLSEEEARILCKEYENEDYFENVIENMTSGPSLALVLARENGLQHWKELIGPSTIEEAKQSLPNSLCVQFAMESLPINQLYGSDSLELAERDIQYFFPPQKTLALIKPHVTPEQREVILHRIKEAGFEITQMKEILLKGNVDKIYYKIANKFFYNDVVEALSEGPSLVMVLSKWNAITDWRRLMGPTDPNEARLLSPDSIRAQFGISLLRNAVHGSTNAAETAQTIQNIFEEVVPENPAEH